MQFLKCFFVRISRKRLLLRNKMKLIKNRIFTILYYVALIIFSAVGFIVNAYYEYSVLQVLLIVVVPTILAVEVMYEKLSRLTYLIVLVCSQLILIIPFSIEFFAPFIDINSFMDLERAIFSPIMIYPVLLAIIFLKWKKWSVN